MNIQKIEKIPFSYDEFIPSIEAYSAELERRKIVLIKALQKILHNRYTCQESLIKDLKENYSLEKSFDELSILVTTFFTQGIEDPILTVKHYAKLLLYPKEYEVVFRDGLLNWTEEDYLMFLKKNKKP